MGRFILISFGLLVTLFVVGSVVSGRTNQEVASACRDGKIDPKAILQSWIDVGVIRNITRTDRRATVEVRTKTWEPISNSAKISIGLAAYCEVIDNTGRAVVTIEGSRMEALGSVVDGNWVYP